jgi:hypothetical protein
MVSNPARNVVWRDGNMVDCGVAGTSGWFNLNSSYTATNGRDRYDGGNNVPKPATVANPLSSRRLWLRLRTPNDTTVNSVQKFRLTVKAGSGSTF